VVRDADGRQSTESAMLDMMEHVGAAMLGRYSNIRVQARRDAMVAVGAMVDLRFVLESTKVGQSGGSVSPLTH
jgi:hypothetical protein